MALKWTKKDRFWCYGELFTITKIFEGYQLTENKDDGIFSRSVICSTLKGAKDHAQRKLDYALDLVNRFKIQYNVSNYAGKLVKLDSRYGRYSLFDANGNWTGFEISNGGDLYSNSRKWKVYGPLGFRDNYAYSFKDAKARVLKLCKKGITT